MSTKKMSKTQAGQDSVKKSPGGRLSSGTKEIVFKGVAASPGVSVGKALVVKSKFVRPEVYKIKKSEVKREIANLERAISKTEAQISKLRDKLSHGSEQASILDTQLMILKDESALREALEKIPRILINADACYHQVMNRYANSLKELDDPYLRERATDIDDVAKRVLRNFAGASAKKKIRKIKRPHIIIAKDLSPTETISIDMNFVKAFATEQGGRTSHTAIIARSQGLPALVGLGEICDKIKKDDKILVDGYNGLLVLNPSPERLKSYNRFRKISSKLSAKLAKAKNKKASTKDGHEIKLSANVEFTNDIARAKKFGAKSVGLYRTEFLHGENKEFPNEDEQTKIYQNVLKEFGDEQVIFRTLDIGGDKYLSKKQEQLNEENPFLGFRGIRVSLEFTEYFKAQIKALLRASTKGKLGIMFPMISSLEEAEQALEITHVCKKELEQQNIKYADNIEIGFMIEIPSAAIIADKLAKIADFFSIGTNDLVQYTLAVDRANKKVAKYYRASHPAVIKLIHQSVQAAKKAKIWIGICGEAAGNLSLTPVFIGLGIDELSVSPYHLPPLREAIRQLHLSECQKLAKKCLQAGKADDVAKLCHDFAHKYYPELKIKPRT